MNRALLRKEFGDLMSERLYLFAFIAQAAIVSGVLYAALLYTSIAAPQTSSFIQTEKPVLGVIGDDAPIIAALQENLEVVKVEGDPAQILRERDFVALLHLRGEGDFKLYLDNSKLLSGYAETIVDDVIQVKAMEIRKGLLEEKMETADIILNPIQVKEVYVGEGSGFRPPEFIIVMYGLLIPFILLLPTFLATNMVTDSIVGEKERKTYEVLVSTPLTRGEIIISKTIPVLLVALSQSFIWMLLLWYKDIAIYNTFWLLILLLIVNLIFIGLGIMLSAISETLKEANISVTLLLLISSIAMFAPLSDSTGIGRLNPVALIGQFASNRQVPSSDLLALIPLGIIAISIYIAGGWLLHRQEALRL